VDHEVADISLVVDLNIFKTGLFEEASECRRGEVKEAGRDLGCIPSRSEMPELPTRGVRYGAGQVSPGSQPDADFPKVVERRVEVFEDHNGDHQIKAPGVKGGLLNRADCDGQSGGLPEALGGIARGFEPVDVPTGGSQLCQIPTGSSADLESPPRGEASWEHVLLRVEELAGQAFECGPGWSTIRRCIGCSKRLIVSRLIAWHCRRVGPGRGEHQTAAPARVNAPLAGYRVQRIVRGKKQVELLRLAERACRDFFDSIRNTAAKGLVGRSQDVVSARGLHSQGYGRS